ncbi:MAG: putative acyl-CoA dehydrogenase [Acidimicrobiia bacterium]|nr:putative acyl-CoA dehydrogenase [Acidimicrobiia bacterium]
MTITADRDEAQVQSLVDQLLAENDPAQVSPTTFLGAQYDLGLAWVHFPVGYGGLGLSPALQGPITSALRAAGAPIDAMRNPIGLGMGAPTVVTHGSEEQKRRYLRPLFTGEDVWCQMFSEPGAGSDVADLATRAERDGDQWIVNGQKVWTSLAHHARWGMLLARTNPDVPKHRGMTYFVVDMHAPGVDVRPLRQMTGDAEFNEVYFTDLRIPDSERLGDVGEGWHVALTTLMNERVFIGGEVPPRGSGYIGDAVRIWKERGLTDTALRDQLMKLWIRADVVRLTNERARQMRTVGAPGPEGSTGKLASAELNKDITNFAVTLMGADGMTYGSYEMKRPQPGADSQRDLSRLFLRMRANSIEGGTSEIMRNILGERVLGLPGDVRVDRVEPWSKLPHG